MFLMSSAVTTIPCHLPDKWAGCLLVGIWTFTPVEGGMVVGTQAVSASPRRIAQGVLHSCMTVHRQVGLWHQERSSHHDRSRWPQNLCHINFPHRFKKTLNDTRLSKDVYS